MVGEFHTRHRIGVDCLLAENLGGLLVFLAKEPLQRMAGASVVEHPHVLEVFASPDVGAFAEREEFVAELGERHLHKAAHIVFELLVFGEQRHLVSVNVECCSPLPFNFDQASSSASSE
jgi:hypothetical protein